MTLHYLYVALLSISSAFGVTRGIHALTVVAIVLLALQVAVQGFRWQLVPVYTLGVLAVAIISTGVAPLYPVKIAGILVGVLLALLAFLLSYAFPDFRMPEPTGPYAVGATERSFSDERGTLTAKVWYPADLREGDEAQPYLADLERGIMGLPPFIYSHLKGRATPAFKNARLNAAKSAYPVLVYAHGGDGFAEDNSFLLAELASHGFITFAVAHPKPMNAYGFDPQLLARHPDEFLAFMADHVMPDRVQDVSIVASTLAQLNQNDTLFRGKLELSKLGLLGYSFGGSVVTEVCATQQTCRAVVNLDGNGFADARTIGNRAPYLHLSQSVLLELADRAQDAAPVSQMAALYISEVGDVVKHTQANGHRAVWLQLKGSGHASFTDMAFWTPLRFGPLHSVLGKGDAATLYKTSCSLTRTFFEDAWGETSSFKEAWAQHHSFTTELIP